ncbi:hypothetical protein JG687_00006558 [Phytophthora cactorum]|uniref:COMM domain-containing protein 3 n=1 Tax=Phytophthora cactorum TaxID=29920 RepID=A0A329RZN3_9STRA|nr:hypothetical protein Pcac1_g952 [Phytophthora cactorum]KAG2790024.1 hypothetical protein Pcac1_g958 [Phytophthora cactorum]KAG2823316.1 hypothetical protein PC112_g10580 [Phytophthora cactorum]KAG2825453.1 hypothetical protein PC111_g9390 [Phytophthora cactorum]KAG2868883.1 hypothetical protein PC113_g661 [Phytophthora cactorum]
MAGGFAGDAAAFLDSDAPVVPRHALEHLSTLSAASLEALVSAAARELTGVSCTSHNTAEQQIPVDNEAFAAICAIVTTFARDGGTRTPAGQRRQLYALGVEDEDLQMKLMPVLSAVVPSVERVLENTSFDFAHVVDVNWRLDYVLRSSSAGSVHEPLYFVQLKLQSPHTSDSTLQTVTFSCTVEELRSLVYRIQEAANEVEKLAAGTPSQLRTNA